MRRRWEKFFVICVDMNVNYILRLPNIWEKARRSVFVIMLANFPFHSLKNYHFFKQEGKFVQLPPSIKITTSLNQKMRNPSNIFKWYTQKKIPSKDRQTSSRSARFSLTFGKEEEASLCQRIRACFRRLPNMRSQWSQNRASLTLPICLELND